MIKYPSISVVIPTFNSEKYLGRCLRSVSKQKYTGKIELIIIDDKSTDNTIKIAKKYTNKIFYSGKHICEFSKSLGIQKSSGDFILFLDSDNVLKSKSSLLKLVKPLLEDKLVVGSYPVWFNYSKKDSAINRYCSLFGINDPLQFFLMRRDRLMIIENKWTLSQYFKDRKEYFLVNFKKHNPLLTLGTIGFLVRKNLLKKINYKPLFFHIDSCHILINKGHTKFAMVKEEIIHYHSDSLKHFLSKLKRNMELFLKYKNLRSNSWALSNKKRLFFSFLLMVTFIVPIYQSMRGFIKKRDWAWFIHPLVCFVEPFLYLGVLFKYCLRGIL